jgi:hypothetical protein
MAYTGADLYRDLKIRTYQGEAGAFLSVPRANYVVNSAVINLLERIYPLIARQQNIDEISPCIKTDKPFIPKNRQVLLKPLIIASAQIQVNPSITFDRPHNLLAGVPIVITGVSGLTGTITTYSVTNAYTISITGYTSTGTYVPNSGYATSASYIIDDYYHLLAVQYRTRVISTTILAKQTNSKQTILTIPSENNIRSGEYLYFVGNDANDSRLAYVKKVAYNKIQLFQDVSLTIPIVDVDSTIYNEGWTISRYYYRYADPLNSDQKIDVYFSDYFYPLYQINDNRLSIVPYNQVGIEDTRVTDIEYRVDYVRTYPPIDLEDSVYDLHQDFNAKFIDKMIEYATLKFNALTSSGEDVQITEVIGGTN